MISEKSYLCVQGWGEGVDAVTVGPLVAGTGVDSIENPEGVATDSLGDFSTLVTTSGATSAVFTTSLDLDPLSTDYDGKVTVALIGVRVSPSTQDSVMTATLTVGSDAYHTAAPIYGQEMAKGVSGGSAGHELIGSGVTNLIFHDLPASVVGSGIEFALDLDNGESIASKSIDIGSVFVGLQIEMEFNPRTFSWASEAAGDRYLTRAYNAVSADGVIRRTVSFEAQRLGIETITGVGSAFYGGELPLPNIFRASIASIGQTMLLSPYPAAFNNVTWPVTPSGSQIQDRLMACRQNFFSVYGLLDRRTEITTDEYRNGLETVYRARMRMGEVR